MAETLPVYAIGSAGIRAFAAESGATEAEIVGSGEVAGEQYTVYRLANVEVIDTNADPVFEGADGYDELRALVLG